MCWGNQESMKEKEYKNALPPPDWGQEVARMVEGWE